MNGHCSTCDVEKECGYPYKPCDCCNYRKFRPKQAEIEALKQKAEIESQNHKEAWDALSDHADSLRAEVERLKEENHNLNWALGTDGYDQMATPEQQAEADQAHARSVSFIDRMGERAKRFAAIVPEGADLLEHLEMLHSEVERLRADAERLDFITEHRVLVSPEFEGCWDATRYDDEPEPVASFSGATPRAAIDAAREVKG